MRGTFRICRFQMLRGDTPHLPRHTYFMSLSRRQFDGLGIESSVIWSTLILQRVTVRRCAIVYSATIPNLIGMDLTRRTYT